MSNTEDKTESAKKSGIKIGRKAAAFYVSLACMMTLALMDKAAAHVLGLIDTLFLVYVSSNVMAKRVVTPNQQSSDSMEKP